MSPTKEESLQTTRRPAGLRLPDGWWNAVPGWLQRHWRRVRRRPRRALRLSETLSLGERRFLAVVEFEQQRFLVGGTNSSLALLAELPAASAAEAGHGEE